MKDRGRQVERMNTNTLQNRERELGREKFVEEGSGKKKKKRESCRNSGSVKDQEEEMKEIEADIHKSRASEKYEEETRISLFGGSENREVGRPRNKPRYVARF